MPKTVAITIVRHESLLLVGVEILSSLSIMDVVGNTQKNGSDDENDQTDDQENLVVLNKVLKGCGVGIDGVTSGSIVIGVGLRWSWHSLDRNVKAVGGELLVIVLGVRFIVCNSWDVLKVLVNWRNSDSDVVLFNIKIVHVEDCVILLEEYLTKNHLGCRSIRVLNTDNALVLGLVDLVSGKEEVFELKLEILGFLRFIQERKG